MKKTFALLLLLGIFFNACKKDNTESTKEDSNPIPENVAPFYAKLTGTWKLSETYCMNCGTINTPQPFKGNEVLLFGKNGTFEKKIDGTTVMAGTLSFTGEKGGCNVFDGFRFQSNINSLNEGIVGFDASGGLAMFQACGADAGYAKYVKTAQ